MRRRKNKDGVMRMKGNHAKVLNFVRRKCIQTNFDELSLLSLLYEAHISNARAVYSTFVETNTVSCVIKTDIFSR